MGFFSKKSMTCVRCGKTFQTRLGVDICDECISKKVDAEMAVEGYIKYAKAMKMPKYSESQLKDIPLHRDKIRDFYKGEVCITKAELMEVSNRFSRLSRGELIEVMSKVANSVYGINYGAGFTSKFFLPTAFDRTIVDVKDIYAVAYNGIPSPDNKGYERLTCAVFTNDPYIPVFPYAIEAKVGFFELIHSKEGRNELESFFETRCSNLKYPVQPLKDFKKFIKAHNEPNKAFILEQLADLEISRGIFAKKYLEIDFSSSTKHWLESAGYLFYDDVEEILKLNKSSRRAIWESALK